MESEVGLEMSTNQTVVVIGGGIWGFSTAFHLAKLGVRNVIVIEQNALPAMETTPRAAGLVGQIRTSAVMCGAIQYALDLFTNFEEQELRDLIKECIESTLGVTLSQPAPSPATTPKPYYTRNETADLLHLSLPTLGKMTKEGRIKGHRLGGKVLYKFTDIEDALKEMRVRGN